MAKGCHRGLTKESLTLKVKSFLTKATLYTGLELRPLVKDEGVLTAPVQTLVINYVLNGSETGLWVAFISSMFLTKIP